MPDRRDRVLLEVEDRENLCLVVLSQCLCIHASGTCCILKVQEIDREDSMSEEGIIDTLLPCFQILPALLYGRSEKILLRTSLENIVMSSPYLL